MFLDANGERVFTDEVELMIVEIAKERHYESSLNEDDSKFWSYYDQTVLGYGLPNFKKGYQEFIHEIRNSATMSSYAACLGLQLRAKPYWMTAISTIASQYTALKSSGALQDVLDTDLTTMDSFEEVVFFIRVNNNLILREILKIRQGETLRPLPSKV